MSQAPWGPAPAQSHEPALPAGQQDPAADASTGPGKRTVLIAAGTGAGLIALAAGAFFLLRGGGDPADSAATPVTHSRSASTSATPSATTSATTVPTVAVNGHNPFASKLEGSATRTSTSTSSTGGAGTVVTHTATSVRTVTKAGPTTTSTRTTTATRTVPGPTQTVTNPAVYLTLLSIGVSNSANFIVNGTASSGVLVGATFGAANQFTYSVTASGTGQYVGTTCARVSYVDGDLFTICPGEQKNVAQ